jgi:hypothetical protein
MFPYITTQYMKMTNKMQLCRIIYYSFAALHLSSDIFAHHQEHLNCITASGITHVCRCQLATYRSTHLEQPRNNKLSYTVASCWSFSYIISAIKSSGCLRHRYCKNISRTSINSLCFELGDHDGLCKSKLPPSSVARVHLNTSEPITFTSIV